MTPPLFRDGAVEPSDAVLAVREDLLQKVLEGSAESIAAQVQEALVKDLTDYFILPATRVAILGTFPDHVVAATERGEFRRVFYKTESNGGARTVQLLHAEKIEVPVVTESTLRAHIVDRAKEVVRLQRTGQTEAANRLTEKLVPFASFAEALSSRPPATR